jgi:predicted permease
MRRWLDILRLRVRSLARRDAADRELARELRFHLDERVAELVAEGMAPAEARRAAGREFGTLASIEQQCRDTRRVGAVANLVQDLRYACRSLRREPMLTVAATASIALGVGVNLSVFGVGHTLLFSRPTAHRPDQLVNVRTIGGSHTSHTVWRAFNDSGALAGIAGYTMDAETNWRGTDRTATVTALIVTANYFDLLNPPMSMGRGFSASEAEAGRGARLAVLGHQFWVTRLGGDASIVGRTIVLNGELFDVLGVLAPGTRSPAPFGAMPDVYVPITRGFVPSLDRVGSGHVQLIGRLRDGQSVDEGHAALAVVAARVAADLDDDRDAALRAFEPSGGPVQAREFREVVFFFLALLVITMLVLTIACANVAGLLLARSAARAREITVRLSLGATRGRLVQQLLTEGFVLALIGVGLGLLLTTGVGALAAQVSLPLPFPVAFGVDFSGRLFWFAAALVVLSGVLSGLTPALHATRPALVPPLQQRTPSYGHRRFTLRGIIVAGQVAISVVLLVVTLLFTRNLALAHTLTPGFDVDRTLVAEVSFIDGRQGDRAMPAAAPMVERLRAIPGITAAAFAAGVPLTASGYNWTGTRIRIEGHDQPVRVDYASNHVSPGYFEAMGIPLRRGRDFTAGDRPGAPVVIVINEEFARRYVPDVNAVGRHLYVPTGRDTEVLAEIVGVVANSKHRTIGEAVEPAIYESYVQGRSLNRHVRIIAASRAASPVDVGVVRAALLDVDGTAAVEVQPMAAAVAVAFLPSRIGAWVMGALGVLGALLATIGLYGVVAFNVGRRTPEVAVRIALGASRSSVLRLMLADTAFLAGIGIFAGMILALAATPLLSSFLVAELSANDPFSFGVTALLVAVTSLLATWRPARRAARVQPSVALRSE